MSTQWWVRVHDGRDVDQFGADGKGPLLYDFGPAERPRIGQRLTLPDGTKEPIYSLLVVSKNRAGGGVIEVHVGTI